MAWSNTNYQTVNNLQNDQNSSYLLMLSWLQQYQTVVTKFLPARVLNRRGLVAPRQTAKAPVNLRIFGGFVIVVDGIVERGTIS